MTVDVAAFVGPFPFRHVSRGTPKWLLGQMDRLGIAEAWVGHLPSFLYRDPSPGNADLVRILSDHERLRPVPAVNPGLPGFASELDAHQRAPAVRAYPTYWGLDPQGAEMRHLAVSCAAKALPLVLTVCFEDLRQRHRLDTATDLPAAAVRSLARISEDVKLVISGAPKGFIEEVHFGLTETEGERVLWDISWIWGPPEEHLRTLLETVGAGHFVFGTGMPLRIPDNSVAKLDLLDLSQEDRDAIQEGNLRQWVLAR